MSLRRGKKRQWLHTPAERLHSHRFAQKAVELHHLVQSLCRESPVFLHDLLYLLAKFYEKLGHRSNLIEPRKENKTPQKGRDWSADSSSELMWEKESVAYAFVAVKVVV